MHSHHQLHFSFLGRRRRGSAQRRHVHADPAARSGEFYVPALIDRHAYEAWLNLGQPSMYSKARERVREILASPVADPLPDGVVQELDEILLAADRQIEEH